MNRRKLSPTVTVENITPSRQTQQHYSMRKVILAIDVKLLMLPPKDIDQCHKIQLNIFSNIYTGTSR
ncbi:hypothetical protein ACHQM5_026773 [Ranunculus cassubicifolius]